MKKFIKLLLALTLTICTATTTLLTVEAEETYSGSITMPQAAFTDTTLTLANEKTVSLYDKGKVVAKVRVTEGELVNGVANNGSAVIKIEFQNGFELSGYAFYVESQTSVGSGVITSRISSGNSIVGTLIEYTTYAYFDSFDGKNSVRKTLNESINDALNPTKYVYDDTIVENNPFDENDDPTFIGWSEYYCGLEADSYEDLIVEKKGDKYTYSDFTPGVAYYAVWANKYGKVVFFAQKSQHIVLNNDENSGFDELGYSWDCENKELTLNNMTLAFLSMIAQGSNHYYDAAIYINGVTYPTIEIKGENKIGSEVDFTDMNYTNTNGNCFAVGIYSDGYMEIKGNGSLRIYDYTAGIEAKYLGFTNDFTGSLTIYDKGSEMYVPEPSCCLVTATGWVDIYNGNIKLVNYNTSAISIASEGYGLWLEGGSLECSSVNGTAIYIKSGSELDILEGYLMVAKEKYDATGSDIAYTATLNEHDGYKWNKMTDYEDAQYISFVAISEPEDLVYDGQEKEVVFSGDTLGNSQLEIKYYDKEKTLISGKPINAGKYSATATFAGKSTSIDFEIEKVQVNLPTAVTGLVYDGTSQLGTSMLFGAPYTLTNHTAINAGDHQATASLKDKTNYEWKLTTPTSDDQKIDYSIAKKDAVVTAQDKTMNLGETVPTFKASETGVIEGDELTYTFNDVVVDAQGVYSIVVSGQAQQGNYNVTFVNGVLTVGQQEENAKADVDAIRNIFEKYCSKQEYNNKTLDVELRIKEEAENSDKELITSKISSEKKVKFIDAQLILIINDDGVVEEKNIGDENEDLINITYTFDFEGKKNIQVLRAHNNVVDELTEEENNDGEYIEIDEETGTITVCAKKYSTYAFAYELEDTVPNTDVVSANTTLLTLISSISLICAISMIAFRKRNR